MSNMIGPPACHRAFPISSAGDLHCSRIPALRTFAHNRCCPESLNLSACLVNVFPSLLEGVISSIEGQCLPFVGVELFSGTSRAYILDWPRLGSMRFLDFCSASRLGVFVAIMSGVGGDLGSTGQCDGRAACRGCQLASLIIWRQFYMPITHWLWLPK